MSPLQTVLNWKFVLHLPYLRPTVRAYVSLLEARYATRGYCNTVGFRVQISDDDDDE